MTMEEDVAIEAAIAGERARCAAIVEDEARQWKHTPTVLWVLRVVATMIRGEERPSDARRKIQTIRER